MSNVEKLAQALAISVSGLIMQLTAQNPYQAYEAGADAIMNIHDEWEIQRKKDEALRQGQHSITLSGYTITF